MHANYEAIIFKVFKTFLFKTSVHQYRCSLLVFSKKLLVLIFIIKPSNYFLSIPSIVYRFIANLLIPTAVLLKNDKCQKHRPQSISST